MWGLGGNDVRVGTRERAGTRDRDGDVRGAGGLVTNGQAEVVPFNGDLDFAGQDVGIAGASGSQVARLLQLVHEVDARLDVVDAAAIRDRRRPHREEGVVRLRRVAVDAD